MENTRVGLAGPFADGAFGMEHRRDRTNAIVCTDAHGRFHEASTRNKLFSVSTGFLGVTAAAANLVPPAAAAATFLTLYNPPGSGVNLSVLRTKVSYLSGTIEVGTLAYCHHPNTTNITATPNAVCKNQNVGLAGSGTTPAGNARGYAQTALTGGAVSFEGDQIGALPNVAGTTITDNVDGAITVPPGAALTIGLPTNGTAMVAAGSILYEEVPLAA